MAARVGLEAGKVGVGHGPRTDAIDARHILAVFVSDMGYYIAGYATARAGVVGKDRVVAVGRKLELAAVKYADPDCFVFPAAGERNAPIVGRKNLFMAPTLVRQGFDAGHIEADAVGSPPAAEAIDRLSRCRRRPGAHKHQQQDADYRDPGLHSLKNLIFTSAIVSLGFVSMSEVSKPSPVKPSAKSHFLPKEGEPMKPLPP